MNFAEFNVIMPALLRNKVVPFVWGAQGIGKTQGVKNLQKMMHLDGFVHLHAATQEIGDLIGLPRITADGSTSHARPEWFPTKGSGIIFLDELNRAPSEVIQGLFSLPTCGSIHTHKLPDNWYVVAAGNYQSNMFQVTDTSDAAWMSRFCHLDFQPAIEEFLVYAEEQGLFTVADFLRDHPEMARVVHKEKFDFNSVTPDWRSWSDMIGKLEKEPSIDNCRFEIYSGLIGTTAAASFLSHKKKRHDSLKGSDILNRFEACEEKIKACARSGETIRFDLLNSALDEILIWAGKNILTPVQLRNFKQFLLLVPLEFGLAALKKIKKTKWEQKNDILNDFNFCALLKQNNQQ